MRGNRKFSTFSHFTGNKMEKMNKIILIMLFLFLVNLVSSQGSITTVVEDLEDCNYRWFCSDWFPEKCSQSGIQTRKCNNAGDCPDTYQKPEERRGCTPELPKQLFDIKLELEHYKVYAPEDLAAWIRFESFGTEPTPINLTYIILDKKENVIYMKEDSLVVETEEFIVEKFEGVNLKNGEYSLLLKTFYGDNVVDEFRQDFVVRSEMRILVYIIIGLVILGIIYLIVFTRKKKVKKKMVLKEEIKDLGTEIEWSKKRKKGGGKKK